MQRLKFITEQAFFLTIAIYFSLIGSLFPRLSTYATLELKYFSFIIYALRNKNFFNNLLFSLIFFCLDFFISRYLFISFLQLFLDYFFPLVAINLLSFVKKITIINLFLFLTFSFFLILIFHTLSGVFWFLVSEKGFWMKAKVSFILNFFQATFFNYIFYLLFFIFNFKKLNFLFYNKT